MDLPLDGVLNLVPAERMSAPVQTLRATYARTPGAPLFRREFGFYCLERWKEQGMPQDVPLDVLFQYDPPANFSLGQIGWCEAAFQPTYEVKVLEDRGEYEVEQDFAGRKVLYFKGRRDGFMPTYIDHPVKDQRTWEEDVLWRMDPAAPGRFADLEERMQLARQAAAAGQIITQNLIGGYMYLRSLMGPEGLLYAFHDQPALIHRMMEAWFTLADAVITRHQRYVTIDEIFFGEDICYKGGPLISPRMIKEFLFPYYQQIIANLKPRQLDRARHLNVQLDTDGFAVPVLPLYIQAIGLDIFSPCEVAAGCDVVELGRQFPNIAIFGGIDKRVLATSPAEIDAHLEHILPVMRARGGYIPTCDHGVPEEVPYQNYLHYRRRCLELGG